MAQAHRVALVLGAGPNVGAKVAERFTSAGYKVAVVSRSGKAVPSSTAALSIAADFTHPEKVSSVFEEVRKKLGQPNVVVYNAAAAIFPSPMDPFSIPLQTFSDHLAINTTSAFAAAKEALTSFDAISLLEKDVKKSPKTFIYTGNGLNTKIMIPAVTLGVGKAASAHLVEFGAAAYGAKGYRFYYADERKADGGFASNNLSGEAHAEHYLQLAGQQDGGSGDDGRGQGEWLQTFVKGKGYVKF